MRWKSPKDGDIKIKKKFALLPIIVGEEIRWLEWVTIKYVYYFQRHCHDKDYRTFLYTGWVAEEFIDNINNL